jgi:predicted alpha/beta superfamily hydrolase
VKNLMRITLAALAVLACVLPAAAQLPPDVTPLQLDSKIMGEKRTALVRLPPSYRTGARAYPVVYMTDGETQLIHTAATADFLVRQGRMPEVIVVGVTNTDRTRDLTPTRVDTTTLDGQQLRFPSSGGADKFLDFFEKELIPEIESRYRVQPFRVFAGHSFGGLFALHALFTRPQLFNGWIAVSPTLTWDDRYLAKKADLFLAGKGRDYRSTLVVTVGDEGDVLRREFDDLKATIARRAPKTFVSQFIYYPDDDHGSVVLPSHFAGLKKVFEPWRFVVGRNGDPRKDFGKAKEHYANLSKRVGYGVPVPEGTTNQIGYRLLQAGHNAEAIEVFKANVEAFPKSANVYDSLGEAYEKAGKLAEARASYERAAAIGAETKDPNAATFKLNAERLAKQ